MFLGHAPDYEEGFDDYKKAVNKATEKFKDISKQIIAIKESLSNDEQTANISRLVGKVQELEETKLHTVVDLQLARQQAFDNLGDELCQRNADLLKTKLLQLEEEITDTLTDIRYEAVENELS